MTLNFPTRAGEEEEEGVRTIQRNPGFLSGEVRERLQGPCATVQPSPTRIVSRRAGFPIQEIQNSQDLQCVKCSESHVFPYPDRGPGSCRVVFAYDPVNSRTFLPGDPLLVAGC